MKTNYKYPFANYATKCPKCGQRRFKQYLYSDGTPIHPTVGRCNREESCGYEYKPKEYLESNKILLKNYTRPTKRISTVKPKPMYVDLGEMKSTFSNHNVNRLILFLCTKIGVEQVYAAIKRYFIGTLRYWNDWATVFWYIDQVFIFFDIFMNNFSNM